MFIANYKKDPGRFYDDLITRLFKNVLHRYERNTVVFSKRGSRERQAPLEQAIQKAVARFEKRWNTTVRTEVTVQAQQPSGEPCLSIVDYMNWAVYRAYTKREVRFYDAISSKVSLLNEIYDFEKKEAKLF